MKKDAHSCKKPSTECLSCWKTSRTETLKKWAVTEKDGFSGPKFIWNIFFGMYNSTLHLRQTFSYTMYRPQEPTQFGRYALVKVVDVKCYDNPFNTAELFRNGKTKTMSGHLSYLRTRPSTRKDLERLEDQHSTRSL
jgi:hypothetical protein